MERQFFAREFRLPGEILHGFGLRLLLANAGVLQKSRSDIVSECKQYVDELYSSRHLEPLGRDETDEFRSFGFGGLGIQENETPELVELDAIWNKNGRRPPWMSIPSGVWLC